MTSTRWKWPDFHIKRTSLHGFLETPAPPKTTLVDCACRRAICCVGIWRGIVGRERAVAEIMVRPMLVWILLGCRLRCVGPINLYYGIRVGRLGERKDGRVGKFVLSVLERLGWRDLLPLPGTVLRGLWRVCLRAGEPCRDEMTTKL